MTRGRAAALAIVSLAAPAGACPCQGSSGPAAVTTQSDRVGASVSETAAVVHGAFRPDGTYGSLGAGVRKWALELTALGGYRPVPRVELGAQFGVARESFSGPGFESERTGLGDTMIHGRWEAIDEPMPFERGLRWPSLTLLAALRMPTASGTRDTAPGARSGTTGSGGPSSSSGGLDAWEPSLALVLVKSIDAWWQVSGVLEGAPRFADASPDRKLGPRWLAELSLRYAASPTTGVGLSTALGGEGAMTIEGELRPETGQRLWTVSAFGYLKTSVNGLRAGTLVRWAPPLGGPSKNAIASTAFGVSLGISR